MISTFVALSVTIEGDELVAQVGTNDTLRGGHVPLNTWAQIAIQQSGDKTVELFTIILRPQVMFPRHYLSMERK